MDGIDYTQPLHPYYTLEEYINAWYIFQREAFMEALDVQFQEEFVAEMAQLLHSPPLPSPVEELYFVGKDDFAAMASASDMPPWPLTTLDGWFSEFADSSPPSTSPLTPPDDMYTSPSFEPLETPQAQECSSDIAFPLLGQNQFADLAPPAFTPYMRNDWPTEPQYWGNLPTNQFEDRFQVSDRGNEYFQNMNGNEQRTISSNPINYEGIELQKNKFGMPAGFGKPSTSRVSTGSNTLYQSQFQRDNVIDQRGPSPGKGKGKRMAEDSPDVIFHQTQASKRARVRDLREPARRMGNQQQMSTCIGSANVAHERPTSNRKPRRRRAPPPKEPKMISRFYAVTGSSDSGGNAKMKTNKSLEMDLPPLEQDPQASMLPIKEICPAKKKIEIDEKNIAVACMAVSRITRAALAKKETKFCRSFKMNKQ